MSEHGDGQRHQVLLVESQPVAATSLAIELEAQGLQVAGPFSGYREAMAWLARSQPDRAIIDVGLEDGCGFALARELRRRGVPFVFLSGAEAFEPEALGEWGDAPWLGKPVASAHLVHILEGLTRKPRDSLVGGRSSKVGEGKGSTGLTSPF